MGLGNQYDLFHSCLTRFKRREKSNVTKNNLCRIAGRMKGRGGGIEQNNNKKAILHAILKTV